MIKYDEPPIEVFSERKHWNYNITKRLLALVGEKIATGKLATCSIIFQNLEDVYTDSKDNTRMLRIPLDKGSRIAGFSPSRYMPSINKLIKIGVLEAERQIINEKPLKVFRFNSMLDLPVFYEKLSSTTSPILPKYFAIDDYFKKEFSVFPCTNPDFFSKCADTVSPYFDINLNKEKKNNVFVSILKRGFNYLLQKLGVN